MDELFTKSYPPSTSCVEVGSVSRVLLRRVNELLSVLSVFIRDSGEIRRSGSLTPMSADEFRENRCEAKFLY